MKFLGLRSLGVKKFYHTGNSKTDNTKEYTSLMK